MDLSKFTKNGKFLMLALDHRGSIKKLINPNNPDFVTDEEIINLKNQIIEVLQDQFSGLLIDETWGLSACHEACHIKPFLLPLEKSGHSGVVELEHSVDDLIKLGAKGAKILIDFDPNSEDAVHQMDISKRVVEECNALDFPLFLEIVTHDPNLVIPSVKMFLEKEIIPDVWKLEYPGNLQKCQELTVLAGETPWILLTGGTSFEQFKSDLEIAAKSGVKGFLAGRAIWQEACTLTKEEKERFLKEILPDRFKIVSEITTKSQ